MTDRNIRCTDVSFVRYDRLPDGEAPVGFGDAASDLCIEFISLSEDLRDAPRKVGEYFDSGAREVWHLFPESRTATVYSSPTETQDYGPEDEIEIPDILPGFHSRVADLFGRQRG